MTTEAEKLAKQVLKDPEVAKAAAGLREAAARVQTQLECGKPDSSGHTIAVAGQAMAAVTLGQAVDEALGQKGISTAAPTRQGVEAPGHAAKYALIEQNIKAGADAAHAALHPHVKVSGTHEPDGASIPACPQTPGHKAHSTQRG